MVLNRFLCLISLLSVLSCQSLGKDHEEQLPSPPGEGLLWLFHPEESSDISVRPLVRDYSLVEASEDTDLNQLLFLIQVSGDEKTHNGQIEKEICQYLYELTTSKGDGSVGIEVPYKSEECVSISITSTRRLFDRDAGEDLSDKFSFFVGIDPLFYHAYILSNKKEWVGTIYNGMNIQEYLSYHPLVFSLTGMCFTEIPPETKTCPPLFFTIGLLDGTTLEGSVESTIE